MTSFELLLIGTLAATSLVATFERRPRGVVMPEWAEAIPDDPRSKQRGAHGFAKAVRDKATGIELLLVAPGTGVVGDDDSIFSDERPRRRIRISRPFYLATTELTVAQWIATMGSDELHPEMPRDPPSLPASLLSRDDVARFLERTAFRLPTECEWEYAARAGRQDLSWTELDREAWNLENSGKELHPVASKTANPWGFFDLAGSVWEWCVDGYDVEFLDRMEQGAQDPRGPTVGVKAAQRGGSAFDDPARVHVTSRGSGLIDRRQYGVGFRVARDPRPPPTRY